MADRPPSTDNRLRMVREQLERRGIRDGRVMEAFRAVPRERFIPPEGAEHAYDDGPLPIGHGQTISQPYIVALTCQSLALTGMERVLEIGTGSGYQTAILSMLSSHVTSVERIPELHVAAARRMESMNVRNVTLILGDGTMGASGGEAFDAIAVSAASPDLPAPLASQLREGGRMVIPVGDLELQQLRLYRKYPGGRLESSKLCDCRFVRLIGRHGFSPPSP